ncbi:MAG: DUF6807 family protein, partial [Planctomycetota bacterium]
GRAEVDAESSGVARVTLELEYRPPGAPPALRERREMRIHPPDSEGAYRMDWHLTFTAPEAQAVLSAPGGYAGLSYRAASGLVEERFLNSEGRRDLEGHGARARWMSLRGIFDRTRGRAAGVAIFDHPTNPRHPTPWFVVKRPSFVYFGPAPLFNEPIRLQANETLRLSYRVLVHPGWEDPRKLESEYDAFSRVQPVKKP